MSDEGIAAVHQRTKPIDLGRDSQVFKSWAGVSLPQHKLLYGLLFFGLVAGSALYVSLGAGATGLNLSGQTSGSQNNSASTSNDNKDDSDDDSATTIPSSNSVNVNLNSSQSSTNGESTNSTTMTVNGQDVPVSGGNVHKTFVSEDGSTKVQINSTNHSSSNGGND